MAQPTHLVPRFWSIRGEEIYTDDFGFLLDTGVFSAVNKHLNHLRDLMDVPCLILLGEQGMGKTTALQHERDTANAALAVVQHVDLGEVSSDTALVNQVFQGPCWTESAAGRERYLLLDAYDECRVTLREVGRILRREFRSRDRTHLRVRIASRTGAWVSSLEEDLSELWPSGISAYELAPMRRRDVLEIACGHGINVPERFFQTMADAEALPLAVNPQHLEWLIALYQRDGVLPRSRFELYERGCIAIVEEKNPSRREAGKLGQLTAPQRLAIAGRLAALTLICGRAGIWRGSEAETPAGWLSIGEASGGEEFANGQRFAVTADGVREVMADTGLFTSRGPERLAWAHRTYGEFLAARHLDEHALPEEQLRSLLLHPEGTGQIVPQLQQVAGWLAVRRREVLRWICAADPQVLLDADLAAASDADREMAVAVLLNGAREQRAQDFDLRYRNYRKLGHPRIAEQLRQAITDKTNPFVARRMAIDISEQCCLDAVSDDLANVALDHTDELDAREWAAHPLNRSGNDTARRRLRGILTADVPEDVNDGLRGSALRALWPRDLTFTDVIGCLTPQRQPTYGGTYAHFIGHDFVAGLNVADLPGVLNWIGTWNHSRRQTGDFHRLSDRVFLRAWDEMEYPGIAEALARNIWNRVRDHEDIFWRPFEDSETARFATDDDKRRRLLTCILPLLSTERWEHRALLSSQSRLVRPEDLRWLIARLDAEVAGPRRDILASLIAEFFTGDSSLWEPLFAAADRHPELGARLVFWRTPIEVNSETATRLREEYAQDRVQENRRAERAAQIPDPQQNIERLLAHSEAGHFEAWVWMSKELTREAGDRYYENAFRSNLSDSPGWHAADYATRCRIVESAANFLENSDSQTDSWFDDPIVINELTLAGFKALRLVRDQDPNRLQRLDSAVWENWLPTTLGHPQPGDETGDEAQRTLVALAFDRVPDQAIKWLRRFVGRENRHVVVTHTVQDDGTRVEHREPYAIDVTRLVHLCWTDRVAAVLFEAMWEPHINSAVFSQILGGLIRHGHAEAICRAVALLHVPLPDDVDARQRCHGAAVALFRHAIREFWPAFANLFQHEPGFCIEVLRTTVSRFAPSAGEPAGLMTEDQQADLCLWLYLHVPPRTETEVRRGGPVGPDFDLEQFRNNLLNGLAARGTTAAVAALDRLIDNLPNEVGLRYVRENAWQRALETSWSPPSPRQLFDLINDSKQRLIRSGDELMRVVVESLKRFEARLQSGTPISFILWNHSHDASKRDRWRPKSEDEFSDVLKSQLEADLSSRGVISNREVELNFRRDYTDIHVVAYFVDDNRVRSELTRLVIEVKGCWNDKLYEAMQSQLRDRYLQSHDYRHGLYVVGWFLCDRWDDDHHQKKDARRIMPVTIGDSQAAFSKQALELSTNRASLQALVFDASLPANKPATGANSEATFN